MVDIDIVDGHGGHGIGHSGLKKRSIAMVHYWVRHAKCTWSSYQFVLVFQHACDVAWCIFLAVHWTAFAILAMFQSIGWRQSLLPAEFSSLLDLVLAIYSFGFLKFVGGVAFEIVFALHNVGVFYQFTMTPNCLYVNYDH